MMTPKNFRALDNAAAPPAKAGTPNPRSPGFSRFLAPPAAIMRISGSFIEGIALSRQFCEIRGRANAYEDSWGRQRPNLN